MHEKRHLGQYYTARNPFGHPAFLDWAARAGLPGAVVLEPFAGANNLIRMLGEVGLGGPFTAYDIAPSDPAVVRRDTLADFPTGISVCVTNPPWLAKNSAKRRGLAFPDTPYDDLYKHSLDLCLRHCRHVAAIIPESFITAGLFHDRLHAVVSLTRPMFDDTEHPVCLALFSDPPGAAQVWSDTDRLGPLDQIARMRPVSSEDFQLRFNDPAGEIGLQAIDDTRGPSIRFCEGTELAQAKIVHSSRALTRISVGAIPGGLAPATRAAVIKIANRQLADWRARTGDVLLTSFKGLRDDGKYRRRLDFANARAFLELALVEALARAGEERDAA